MPTRRYWISPVPVYDDFGNLIDDEFIDGASNVGRWAIFTPAAWAMYGCGSLGTGRGQRYKREAGDPKFYKVEG